MIAVLAGYAAAIICGIVDFEEVAAAKIIAMPHFSSPKFDAQAIMIILPVILVIISEHIGHQVVTSKIVGRDLLKIRDFTDPYLQITSLPCFPV